MEIVSHQAGKGGTVVYLKLDNGEMHGHAIPYGVLEQRAEAWQLPDDIDALDVVLVEAHYASEEMPEFLFDDEDYLASREKVLGLVRKHRGKVTGKKAEAMAACHLPAEEATRLRSRLRSEFDDRMAAPAQPATPALESSERLQSRFKEIRLGYERLAEERLADDIIQDNPELQREPRVRPGETVGLTVKLV
jgi:hypothetical protein